MVADPRRTAAVRRAIEATPTSLRALAREAGVPHPTLVNIRAGKLGASEAVARKVLRALRSLTGDLEVAAEGIEDALDRV